MPLSEKETMEAIAGALEALEADQGITLDQVSHHLPRVFENYRLDEIYFVPSKALLDAIALFQSPKTIRQNKIYWQLLEEIALLAFKCLRGTERFESYRSISQQHDLIVSGSGLNWHSILRHLGLCRVGEEANAEIVILECKNTNSPVDDSQFTRLCSILQNKFTNTSRLAVFFSRNGATGFPARNKKSRTLCLRDAWASQLIFHARTDKFVVVLDQTDIVTLTTNGSLIKILKNKIQEIERATGREISIDQIDGEIVANLPSHLAKHLV